MGPSENPTSPFPNQERTRSGQRKRPRRRPRTRRCLLKGCKQRYRPRRARQRYCSPECQQAARNWSYWKAQRRYRSTAAGHEKRNGQSRRYRERVRNRKAPKKQALPAAARVITIDFFSRPPVIVRAATWSSIEPGDHRCSASARRSVDTRSSAFGSGNGAGGRGGQGPAPCVALRGPPEIVAVVMPTRGAAR